MQPGELVEERFVVEHLAASGGMASLYRGRDRVTGRPIALKALRVVGPKLDERFAREARVLAELRHPGIVEYVWHGRTSSGELYLAMEWIEGEDLRTRLARTAMTVEDTLGLATRVAAALAAAHARDVVHRDVSPGNLFLANGDARAVKILDFGLARVAALAGDRLTTTGEVMGTPMYMAPEQALQALDVDARADVFSLGAVLFHCLTGRPPFNRGASPLAAFVMRMNEDAPRLRTVRPELGAQLDDLVARMLARDPDQRPANAGAVLTELLALDPVTAATRVQAPQRDELTTAERRVVSAVVLGSLGMQTLTEDGEHLAALGRALDIGTSYGGRVVRLPDLELVVFEEHSVASDLASLAAVAALAMRRAAPDLPLVIVTGHHDGSDAPGLQTLRRWGPLPLVRDGVRIDDVTAGLIGARFAVGGDELGLILKGESGAETARRTLLGKPTPFIGRDAEMAMILGLFRQAIDESQSCAVLVTASAGMGKTRLRHEVVDAIRAQHSDVEVWIGRADPMRARAPFSLVADAIRGAAGIAGDELSSERWSHLHERIARHLPATDVGRVTEFLSELIGIGGPGEPSAELVAARNDPQLMLLQMTTAWERWVVAECTAHPVVLALEDLHWGDASTMRMVGGALRAARELPLFVFGVGRPELHEQFPRLWTDCNLRQIHLGELSRRAAERLVRQSLGDRNADRVAEIIDRAAGNAFYLEELVRHVAEGGLGIPETVLAMVQARLAAMEADARRVVRAASVFGATFWKEGVRALVGGTSIQGSQLEHWLAELERREVIQRHLQTRFPGDEEYVFRHALVREAAYSMLTEEDRRLGHQLAARWLESAGEDEALVLAEHFERGGDLANAAAHLERANQAAIRAEDVGEATACFDQAMHLLAQLPETDDTRRRKISLILGQLPVVVLLMKFPEYLELLARTEPEVERLADPALLVALYSRLGQCHWASGELDKANEFLARAIDRGDSGGSYDVSHAWASWMVVQTQRGDFEKVLSAKPRLLHFAEQGPHARWRAYGLGAVAMSLVGLGRLDEGAREAEASLAEAERSGEPGAISFAAWIVCLAHAAGDPRRAIAAAEQAAHVALTQGDKVWASCALANALVRAGQATAAIEILSQLLPMMRQARFAGGELFARALPEAYLALGRHDEALTAAREFVSTAESFGMRFNAGVGYRILGEIAIASRTDDAKPHLRRSAEILRELSASHEAAIAESLLARVDTN